jgi:hypothetical protein
VILPRTGLQFSGRVPFDVWLDIGRQLSAVVASSAWCLGDWLAYGQHAYGNRYRDAVEQTGLDYQTLRNYAWVARRFELSRRRDTLSFRHHAEVASLPAPEQDFWLRKAEQFAWSASQLRREVRTSLHERSQSGTSIDSADLEGPGPASPDQPSPDQFSPDQPSPDRHVIEIPLTREQSQMCELAASRAGLPLSAWAAQMLDHAARCGLPGQPAADAAG